MALVINTTITLETETCITCGCTFAMPVELKNKLLNDPNKAFYCPSGHTMCYSKSKEQRLREEAQQAQRLAEQRLANEQAKSIQLEAQLKKEQNKLKRVHNGVCPCCNRSFKNLGRHMAHMHPETVKKK
jgi:hypothetical protein